jgi:anti-sigma regulatory factor (Ser/Thr protein kinase)
MCWRADTRLDERELRRLRTAIRADVAAGAESENSAHVVELIVGELIGNVQRYAPGPFCTELHWSDDSLHLSVHDPGPCFVPDGVNVTEPTDWEAERGRGLAIIKALGGTVHTHREDDKGCRVDVDLRLPQRAGAVITPPDCPNGHPAARGAHCPRIQQFLASSTRLDAAGRSTASG